MAFTSQISDVVQTIKANMSGNELDIKECRSSCFEFCDSESTVKSEALQGR